MNDYKHLIVKDDPSSSCIVILSRWDGQRAKVFPSKRDRWTGQAIVFEPWQVEAELDAVERIVAAPDARGGMYCVTFAPPDEAQAEIDRIAADLQEAAERNMIPLESRGFSREEIAALGISVS